ncbi:MAG: DUF6261 family protein [Bacteroidales bacterium]|jgi:hypothetical protein|nr:DUF6261 family protein [Bacteroidales bacterium]
MKVIIRINYTHLRNEAHVEFHETADAMIVRHNPAALGIDVQYGQYKPLLDAEVSLLDVIRKSGYTVEIKEADHRRDMLFRGFADAVKSALNHFDPAKREAARRIEIVLDNYGNIAAKALDQETAAIDDLLRELGGGEYPALVGHLALADWLVQLDAENRNFKTLMMARYGETSQRPATRMKAARKDTDVAFRNIIDRIEALATVNGIAACEPFIRELNAVIERYKNILAAEAGRRKKETDSTEN